jgi:hypothetical protein
MLLVPAIQVVLFHGLLAYAQSSFQLGNLPLVVKTPYFNGWFPSSNGSAPERVWSNVLTLDHVRSTHSLAV